MRKILILLLFLVIGLSGCFKNSYINREGSLTLTIRDEYAEKMPYDETPSYTFNFEGILRTNDNVPQPYYVIFGGNNDYHLSEQISNLFAKYEDRIFFDVVVEKDSNSERLNNRDEEWNAIPEFLPTDDGKVYYEVAYIMLENGMKLTLDYRRFVSDNVNYYVWRYESNISMTLYYPLMVIEENGEKEIVLLTLPNRIKYQVGPQLKIVNILKDPDYLEPARYTLKYLDEHETIAQKQKYVSDYYLNDCGGKWVNEKIHFTYLGINYSVEFHNEYFTLKYIGRD